MWPDSPESGHNKLPAYTPKSLAGIVCLGALSAWIFAGSISLRQIDRSKIDGVAAVEVNDYVYGGYQGDFPSPPHADLNPRKAFVVYWHEFPQRLVFSHEAELLSLV